jgi:superfamily II DNA or RNA helicase
MFPPITRKILVDWAGAQVVHDAETLVERGQVVEAEYEPPLIKGAVLWNNRQIKTAMELMPDGHVESHCPCYATRERGIICPHVIALGLLLIKRATDPQRDAKYQAELRRSSRLASIPETEYLRRVPSDTLGAVSARLLVTLDPGWQDAFRKGGVPVSCAIEYRDRREPLDAAPKNLPFTFTRPDENLLFVLEDISAGPAKGRLELAPFDFLNVVKLHEGRELSCADGTAVTVNKPPVTSYLQMDLDRENGELILILHTELPFLRPGEFPSYLVSNKVGWAFGAGNLWPLANVLPGPYHAIYAEPITLCRAEVLRFLKHELATLSTHIRIESDITLDLFSIDPAAPRFILRVKGSPASLSAVLLAAYGDIELVAGKPDPREHFAIPDPGDLMRYTVRNPKEEQKALQLLSATGFKGEVGDALPSIVGRREVLNFLGTQQQTLRRRGWRIEMDGRVVPFADTLTCATPVVRIADSAGAGWFDVGFGFDDNQGVSLSPSEVHQAIRKGESFVEKNGRVVLIDTDAVSALLDVFSDCESQESPDSGHFRLDGIYAPFVKSSLDALDGVDVEDSPAWRAKSGQHNRTVRIEPAPVDPRLAEILRPYQKEGVDWLYFLERSGFAGILADEMGLGKTVQTLVWLDLKRQAAPAPQPPALIVCPTSIVENWAEEIARFTPARKALVLTGSERHTRWEELPGADIAITSYAILRRDLDQYLEHEFSAIVLDEAQHIKNRSTQNAIAAKKLRATHRLVLTGTPIENSVSDLWSIMDFLMPGYLGRHDAFRQNYELPISRGGPDSELSQLKLRRKLHPFLLRRLKTDVARDLPPKIEKISSCSLSGDQKMVYDELLRSSRTRIADMVAKMGFQKCRMEILTTLTRLRQVCCHLDLLKNPNLKSGFPSAKMDLFFELLDEAVDGGHRVLIFSQFVSMLQILQAEMDKRQLAYCYLDGSTQNRMEVVHNFNTQRDIPAFLISLKAGGTGLNLTGADMVVHFDPWWNPAVEDQATDRAHRIGQKRTVYCIKLITKGTVEEKVLALQKKKQAVIDATLRTDEGVMETLSWDDVQELLSL